MSASVILPSGVSYKVDDLNCSINLSSLIAELKSDEYTFEYKIAVAKALGTLGKHAKESLTYLKILGDWSTSTENPRKLLGEVSLQSIKRIEDDLSSEKKKKTSGTNSNSNYGPNSNYGNGTNSNFDYSQSKKLEYNKIEFEEIDTQNLCENETIHCRCAFCDKRCVVYPKDRWFGEQLTCSETYYCDFCLRHDYYMNHSKNVMVLSFKGILGYYFYSYHVLPKTTSQMTVAEVQEFIDGQYRIGMNNPVFNYNKADFTWFIDFNKIGKGKRKIPVDYVLKTIIAQLTYLNLYENVPGVSPKKVYNKYQEAVMTFYKKREKDSKVFIPTLWGCGIPTVIPTGCKPIPLDVLKDFNPYVIAETNYNNRTARRW